MPRYQVVIQFQLDDWGNLADFDHLVALQEKLDGALRRNAAGAVE